MQLNSPTITTILNVYKRLNYLEEQLESLRSQTIPTKIWIDYTVPKGEPIHDLTQIAPEAKITIHQNQNLFHIGRFYHAFNIQTPYVFIIDDDILPGKNYLKHCVNTMNEVGDCILTTYGLILDSNTKKYTINSTYGWHSLMNGQPGHSKPQQVDVAGHSWFFKKSSLKYITYEDPITIKNGEDLHFSYCCNKYGNLPIIVPSHEKSKPENWGCDVKKGWMYGTDKHATWRREDHVSLRNQIVESQVKRGWKLCRNN